MHLSLLFPYAFHSLYSSSHSIIHYRSFPDLMARTVLCGSQWLLEGKRAWLFSTNACLLKAVSSRFKIFLSLKIFLPFSRPRGPRRSRAGRVLLALCGPPIARGRRLDHAGGRCGYECGSTGGTVELRYTS